MKDQQRFKAEIQKGHKGEAVVVPFNPSRVWDAKPAEIEHPWRLGYLVAGTLNGCPFEGWIGFRWGRFFMLVPEELRGAAGVSIGDEVQIVVAPRGTAGTSGTGAGPAGRLGPARSKRTLPELGPARSKRTLPELPTKNPTPSTTRTRR